MLTHDQEIPTHTEELVVKIPFHTQNLKGQEATPKPPMLNRKISNNKSQFENFDW